jgi:hypothetical protein
MGLFDYLRQMGQAGEQYGIPGAGIASDIGTNWQDYIRSAGEAGLAPGVPDPTAQSAGEQLIGALAYEPPAPPPAPEETIDVGSDLPGMGAQTTGELFGAAPGGQPISPGRVAGFRWAPGPQTQTVQTQEGRAVDPMFLAKTRRATELQKAATGVEATAQQMEAARGEEATAQKMLKAAEQRQAAEKRRGDIQGRVEQQLASRQTAVQELKGMDIDPNRYWSSMSAGQKAANVIGIALSTFGAALARTPNVAVQAFERNIERDIAAQRAKIEGKKGEITETDNVLSHLYKRLGDLDQAEGAAKQLLLEDYKDRLTLAALQSQSPQVKASAMKLKAGLEERQAQIEHGEFVDAQSRGVRTESMSRKPIPLVLGGGRKPITKKTAPKDFIQKKIAQDTFRKHLNLFYDKFKKLGLPTAATAWTGEQADRVNQMQTRVADSLARKLLGSNVSAEAIDKFRDSLARPFSGDADVRERVRDLLHETDDEETALISNYSKVYDVKPWIKDYVRTRLYQTRKYGLKYPTLQRELRGK